MGVRGVIPKIQLIAEHMASPEKLTGQRIKVKVLEVDEVKNRLVVSEKAVHSSMSNKELEKQFAEIEVGKSYDALVLGTSEFGIFCEVHGVEGLIHISEISWEKVHDASLFVQNGETVPVFVVENMAHKDDVIVCIVSKSGNTTETMANANILIQELESRFGSISDRIVAITDPGSAFATHAASQKYRVLTLPKNVGGRYSVFSAVGVFPHE
jgi:ribosomal protein S1